MDRGLTMLFTFFALWPAGLRADTIVLDNGYRLEGEIVEATDFEVRIRLRYGTSGITYVHSIKRSHVDRIEKSPLPPASRPAAAPSSQPAKVTSLKKWPLEDKSAYLRAAIQKWKNNDARAAGILLSRLINNCASGELQTLSDEVRRELEMPLMELAAEVHFTAAQRAARGRAIRLSYITHYELPALSERLMSAYESAVQEPVQPKQLPVVAAIRLRSAKSQPAEAGAKPTIAAWIDHPDALKVQPNEAAALVRQIQYASSLLSERMRLDRTLRQNPTMKAALLQERIRLMTLIKVADAVATGTIEPTDSETDSEEDEEEPPLPPLGKGGPWGGRKQDLERAQLQEETYLRKAMRLAQEEALQNNKP